MDIAKVLCALAAVVMVLVAGYLAATDRTGWRWFLLTALIAIGGVVA
ncbi:hypothetical protein SAMN05880590_10117 [Rhizobium sp. RU35A]|nr:hypothetical protein SAMN05880590_10117 [Rhizobium sp. RU35A]